MATDPTGLRRYRRLAAATAAGALALATMIAGGIALAAIVDRITLGAELTVTGATGLLVTQDQNNPGTYTVTIDEGHKMEQGWRTFVTEENGDDAGLNEYYTCESIVYFADTDIANEGNCFREWVDLWNATDGSAHSIQVTIARNDAKLIGIGAELTLLPELVLDNGQ